MKGQLAHTHVLLHVPIGQYSLPVPLVPILIAAVIVVAGSFALIYWLPQADEQRRRPPAGYVPEALTWELRAVAAAYVVFLIAVCTFGRQGLAALNAGSLLFWVWTIPLLPLLHCFVGGVYQLANPFAGAAELLAGGRRLPNADAIVDRLGFWPALVFLLLIVEGESITEVVQSPAVLGYAVIMYTAVQISAGMLLGPRWYRGGEVFHALTQLASTIAPISIRRDRNGHLRLVRGFSAGRFLPEGAGRNALITLWLAGVLADGVRATPAWRATIVPALGPTFESLGRFGGVDMGSALEVTTEIVVTWIAFGVFFWVFVTVAAAVSQSGRGGGLGRERLWEVAGIVAPSLIPIALAYLFAHNLTQLLVVGPLMWVARDAQAAQLGAITASEVGAIAPHVGLVWWTQAGSIVLGHIVAVVMAHERLARHFEGKAGLATGAVAAVRRGAQTALKAARAQSLALRADLGWLSAMLIYTATSLWVLAQPITAGR